jgi:hypothetical protein
MIQSDDEFIKRRAELLLTIEDLMRQHRRTTDYAERIAIIADLAELRMQLADLQNKIVDKQLQAVKFAKPLNEHQVPVNNIIAPAYEIN